MTDNNEVESVLFALFAQVQRALSAQESDRVHRLIEGGSHRQAVEAICSLSKTGRYPMPLQARAMAFRLADRLDMQPADLGLLA